MLGNIYEEEDRLALVENDEIDWVEASFMEGYCEAC